MGRDSPVRGPSTFSSDGDRLPSEDCEAFASSSRAIDLTEMMTALQIQRKPVYSPAASFSALRWATASLFASISVTRSRRRRMALQSAFN